MSVIWLSSTLAVRSYSRVHLERLKSISTGQFHALWLTAAAPSARAPAVQQRLSAARAARDCNKSQSSQINKSTAHIGEEIDLKKMSSILVGCGKYIKEARWRFTQYKILHRLIRPITTLRLDFTGWNWWKIIYVGNASWKQVPFYIVFGNVVLLNHSGNKLWMS